MSIGCCLLSLQLKYHDTGREKDCLPQVGQWNMMNKVLLDIIAICISHQLWPICSLSLLFFLSPAVCLNVKLPVYVFVTQ